MNIKICLPFLESPDADIAMEIATSEQHVSEAVYDCVICGQSGPSTEDRPTGLVVLLQASSGMIKGILGTANVLRVLIYYCLTNVL